MENTTMTMTEQRGFSGTYDADGHRQDVIALLQGGKTGEELMDENAARITSAVHSGKMAHNRALTAEQVSSIRSAYRRGDTDHSTYAIARHYGVSQMVIWKIVNGLTYREVAA